MAASGGGEEKSKKKTTGSVSLIDYFRKDNDDGHESHSKRAGLFLVPTKLKRVGLMMISSVFGRKKKTAAAVGAESCCFSEGENGKQSSTSGRELQQTSFPMKVVVAAKEKFSFKRLFGKKGVGFGFLRGKNKSSGKCRSENGFGRDGIVIEGREESSGVLQRVSSRVAISHLQRLKTGGGSIREKSSIKKNGGGGEQRVSMELCKKRILMGERCRPLNKSGTLQYDEDGILLPDVLL